MVLQPGTDLIANEPAALVHLSRPRLTPGMLEVQNSLKFGLHWVGLLLLWPPRIYGVWKAPKGRQEGLEHLEVLRGGSGSLLTFVQIRECLHGGRRLARGSWSYHACPKDPRALGMGQGREEN